MCNTHEPLYEISLGNADPSRGRLKLAEEIFDLLHEFPISPIGYVATKDIVQNGTKIGHARWDSSGICIKVATSGEVLDQLKDV